MSENEEIGARHKMSEKMNKSVQYWGLIINKLNERIKLDHLKDITNVQAEAISYRQEIIEEVRTYSIKIYKLLQKVKTLNKSRFEFYATSYQVKTNGTEKVKLIDADLSEYQCFIDELDEHVTFLRETSKNLDNLNYAVKNRIEIANILGT